ncbi:DnaJ domain-containing protein [Thermodesulforhabdus norvegica]|uniref:DnaJ domain-containing protein n=1 Tax=Thermodesulforhabdus norvegica TaxID=39841 RepID=A0A1I4W288_9BACT|nr:DnaJ domain-containing protein [Thermodesulforhabdus norvegica]SFN07592.1 DnaJ domain-containing protein [Thermodesulforhabdus norvegica]
MPYLFQSGIMKDYYKILNVPEDASPETIHDAYRKAAKMYHPDVAETGNHEKFLEIREAYEVLSDPERRRRYDIMRGSTVVGGRSTRSGVRPPVGYPVIRAELILTPREAYYGGLFTVDVPFATACPWCGGGMWHSWFCDLCGGSGSIVDVFPVDVKVPPRVLPGTVILKDLEIPGTGRIRMEFFCRIRWARSPWRRCVF